MCVAKHSFSLIAACALETKRVGCWQGMLDIIREVNEVDVVVGQRERANEKPSAFESTVQSKILFSNVPNSEKPLLRHDH